MSGNIYQPLTQYEKDLIQKAIEERKKTQKKVPSRES